MMKDSPCLILMRPQPAAKADIDVCINAGWTPLLLEYQYLQPDLKALSFLPQQSVAADVVLWVSPSAVHIAANYVSSRLGCLHVAVGAGTARALSEYGFPNVIYPQDGQDSEAVARLPLWQLRSGKVLLIRGHGGRNFLLNSLHELMWQVDVADVYRRIPQSFSWSAVMHQAQQGNLKAIYLTTTTAVDIWFSRLPPDLYAVGKSLLYLVHHPRVAGALSEYKVSTLQVPDLKRGLALLNSSSTK